MADNHVIACQGTAAGLQILAGPYKQRLSLVAAEIGTDDVIIGGEILELPQGGFGKPGFWAMTVKNKILEIPLIGQHSCNAEVEKVQGAKKIKKLLQEHGRFGQIGFIWKSEGVENSTDSQDEDAQNGLLGVDKLREAIGKAHSCASKQTTSSQSTKMARRKARDLAIQAQIDQDKLDMAGSSARIKERLREEFPTLFTVPEHLPPLRWDNHRGDLEPGARPPPVRGLPRMSKAEMDETGAFLKDMLKRGWIEPSLVPYGAPFFFVPKPNGRGLRAVCDFRAINNITKKVLPSLPLFENIVTQLEGAKFFSGLDLTSQFYQIRVEPDDVPKTSFRTCQGLYNWKVTPMGMTGSVGTAMNCMQQVLQHVISLPGEELPGNPRTKAPLPDQENFPDTGVWKQHKYHSSLGSYTCLFVDDILCFSRTEEDHVRHLRQVCATLEQHHLYLNFDKIEIC